MINSYYKNFKIRDYLDNDGLFNQSSEKFIDCSLGTNPFIENEKFEKYLLNYNCEINRYPSNEYQLLKNTLVSFWNNFSDYTLNINNIAFGAGVMGIIRNISEFLFEKDTNVLGCAPQFPRFISEVELKKSNYEYYSLDEKNNFRFIANDFITRIKNKHDIIHIENPNNPTGQIINIQDIEIIVQEANKKNILVIIDEAYGDYMSSANSSIQLVNKYKNVIVLRSASKFYGLPNHRIGYLFASEELIKIYNKISIPFPFSDLSASIFRNIINDYKTFNYTKSKVIEINNEIYSELNNNNYLYTSLETPIFTIKSNKYDNLYMELIKNGILAENCSYFINLNSNYARLRINKNHKEIIRILKKLL